MWLRRFTRGLELSGELLNLRDVLRGMEENVSWVVLVGGLLVFGSLAVGLGVMLVYEPLERTMAMIGAEIVMAGIGIVFAYIATLKLR